MMIVIILMAILLVADFAEFLVSPQQCHSFPQAKTFKKTFII